MKKTNKKEFKNKSALIIGFGSIGEKHAMILKKYFNFKKIFIFTKRKIKKSTIIKNLDDIKKLKFDYVVISSNTSEHYSNLCFILKNFKNKKIFLEKPLFTQYKKIKIKNNNNKIFIGYNLRFHPLLKYLKHNLNKSKIYSIKVICNSFLPDWRKNVKYIKSNSAIRNKGGGVILDLSHEIDYIRWIFGNISLNYVQKRRIANITKNTEDSLYLKGRIKNSDLTIDLNYFSRIPKRLIYVDAANFSLVCDLVLNKLIIKSKSKKIIKNLKKISKNFTYIEQHKAILSNKIQNLCNYRFASETMQLLDKIRKSC